MKRTESYEVVASLLERHVSADEGRDIDARSDLAENALIVSHYVLLDFFEP